MLLCAFATILDVAFRASHNFVILFITYMRLCTSHFLSVEIQKQKRVENKALVERGESGGITQYKHLYGQVCLDYASR